MKVSRTSLNFPVFDKDNKDKNSRLNYRSQMWKVLFFLGAQVECGAGAVMKKCLKPARKDFVRIRRVGE